MKKENAALVASTLVCLLPLAFGAALYARLPAEIATHWNFAGEADGWSSRAFAVFGIPLILTAIHALCFTALRADPRRANVSPALRALVLWLVPAVSVLVAFCTYGAALGCPISVSTVVPLFVGALFVLVGLCLPKTKQSYTVGIRLPWTLHSEENWNRTHRLAGFLWVLAGIAFLVLTLLRAWSAWALIALIAVIVLVPCLYSYLLYRKGV